jgi:hypothetical protein
MALKCPYSLLPLLAQVSSQQAHPWKALGFLQGMVRIVRSCSHRRSIRPMFKAGFRWHFSATRYPEEETIKLGRKCRGLDSAHCGKLHKIDANFGYTFGYRHQFGFFTLNCAKLSKITLNYAYLS